jgi:uncharacterized membrane protein YkoI
MAHPLYSMRWLALPLSLALLAGSGAAYADREDHERARKALEAGEVLPLKTILERVEQNFPGQVMDVELERERVGGRERWIYEIKVLRTGGALVKLKLDARDGSVMGNTTRSRAPAQDRER